MHGKGKNPDPEGGSSSFGLQSCAACGEDNLVNPDWDSWSCYNCAASNQTGR